MKPTVNYSGINFDAIPMWIYPDVWDENKPVKFRGLCFILLYTLSFSVFANLLFLPVGLYHGKLNAAIWIAATFGAITGVLGGVAAWYDFSKCVSKLKAAEKNATQESPDGN